MKIAFVVMDGLEQFVLTSETDVEKRLIDILTNKGDRDVSIHRGSFYHCQGGWYRQGASDDSALIVFRPKSDLHHEVLPVFEEGRV